VTEPGEGFRWPEGILEVRRLGRSDYSEAHRLQLELVDERAADKVGDVLILTEHDEIVTLGRASDPSEVEAVKVPVVSVERGGHATWHGPGQVVAYPIFKLSEHRRDLHRYLRDLEQVVIDVLAELDVEGRREPGLTGVWIGAKKVCSIGVAVRRWVTYHGLALNLSTDPEAFRDFQPCGLSPEVMTRVVDHAELPPARLLVEVLLVKHFCRAFGLELPSEPPPGATPAGGASSGGGRFPELPILPS
jgi:lipoate-protein ligase B